MAERKIKRVVPLRALFGTTISAHDKEITIHCIDHDVRDEIMDYLLGCEKETGDAAAVKHGVTE
jgi:hypothetical protein